MLSEQTAIAEILSDMDAGISAREATLWKEREVKAGTMSVLLTLPKAAGRAGEVGVIMGREAV